MQCVSDTAYVKYELYMHKFNLFVGVSPTIYSGTYPNCWTLLDHHPQNFTPASQTQTQQPKPSPQPSPQPSASPAELMYVGGKCFSETQGMPCFAVYVTGGEGSISVAGWVVGYTQIHSRDVLIQDSARPVS